MDGIIEFLNGHASLRHFTDRDISEADELTIVSTAERSPTSSNLHAYSIISVRDQSAKERLAKWSGDQDHVAACPLFLVFCADLHRLEMLARDRHYDFCGEYTEPFIVATVDAALAGGRALMAAQALGLGGVMVGAIRNHPDKVSELLNLPDLVYPVMGMSLGYPAREAKLKARLPLEGLYFKEKYRESQIKAAVEEYDKIIDEAGYLRDREVEKDRYRDFAGLYSWSEHSARRMASRAPTALRPHLLGFLQARGLLKK